MLYQSHPEYPHPCCIAPHRPECWEVRYLAVAHFGRVRGEWRESEYPAFWLEAVTQACLTETCRWQRSGRFVMRIAPVNVSVRR